ncbi:MAG: CIA30 family protein [Pseudomonadota bacterium]
MRGLLIAIVSLGIMAAPAFAEAGMCTTLIEHSDADTENPWRTINDGVMGGRSSGGSALAGGALVFRGVTNTNGGGFSSIRLPIARGALAGADHLRVHMKRDARTYSVTLRTDIRRFGRPIAFRAPIVDAPEGAWGDWALVFDTLKASFDGTAVPDAVFDPAEATEIGIIIYDGRDGPFEMALKRIEACAAG